MEIIKTKRFQGIWTRLKSFNILPHYVAPHGNTLIRWMIVGYIIRVALIPLFPNRDPLALMRVAFVLKERHQLIPTAYPEPITYFLTFIYIIFDPLLPRGVFSDFFTNTAYTPDLLSVPFRISEPGLFTYLFITKMPFLAFDLLLGFMLLYLLKDSKQSLLAFKLWMINPVTLYVSYAFGQYDIIPVFFIILSLYFLQNERMKSTMLSLGVASAFKTFGLLFALPITLFFVKRFTSLKVKVAEFLLLIAICLLPLVLSKTAAYLTPVYYLPTNVASSQFDINGFFGHTLYLLGRPGSPSLTGLLIFGLDYSLSFKTFALFDDVIYVFPLIYTLLLLALIFRKDMSFKTLWKAMLVFLLMYYATSLFHPQWFLYAQPLLILLVIDDRKFLKAYVPLILLYFVYIQYWSPDVVVFLDSIGLHGLQFINVFRSIFSGVCIFIAALIILPDSITKRLREIIRDSRMTNQLGGKQG